MKTTKFFFATACVLGLAVSCFAQNADANESTQRGIQAARAAAHRALKARNQGAAEAPTAASLISGTFAFTITIDLHPGFPTQDKIYCSADVSTSEEQGLDFVDFDASGDVAATISGSTATCTINLKYGWYLATPGSDSVGLSVGIDSVYGSIGTIPWYDNSGGWSGSLSSVPASGSTTTEKVTLAL